MMAADLALAGHDVILCELARFKDQFQATLEKDSITLTGVGREGVAHLHQVTVDMEQALSEAELVNVVVPTNGHDSFFEEMIPFLRDGQLVVMWAGRFGSLRLRQLLLERGERKEVIIAEVNTLPYGTRLIGPAHVHQFLTGSRVLVSALPSSYTEDVVGRLEDLHLQTAIVPAKNVLEAAFNNSALIVFPSGATLNTGRIQYSEGEFYMFKEGITEAVARCIRAQYDEMVKVAASSGFSMLEYEDQVFRSKTSVEGVEQVAPFDTIGQFEKIKGPTSVPHRYFVENIGYGLVPVQGLAQMVGISVPLIDGLITLGSVVCGIDFQESGRPLHTLGLADKTKDEIIALVDGA